MRKRMQMAAVVLGTIAAVAVGSTAIAAATSSVTSSTAATSAAAPGRGPSGPGGRGGPGCGGDFGVGLVDVVSKLTGEPTSTVDAARQKGTSFAAIAKAKGVTVARIVDLAMRAPKAALASEVSDGLVTRSEADSRLAELETRLTAEVNAAGALPGPGGFDHRGGPPAAGSTPPTGTPPGPPVQ